MTKHQAVSPDFVSRQVAATRLMLSLRQVDRLLTQGVLIRAKVSANRTGIPRASFEAYLIGRGGFAAEPSETIVRRPTIESKLPVASPMSPPLAPVPVSAPDAHFSPEQQNTIIKLLSSIFARR